MPSKKLLTARCAMEPALQMLRFFSADRLPGFLILVAMIVGLAAANSPLQSLYLYAHHATVHLGIGSLTSDQPVIFWINEGLMVFFFLLVGAEIKQELLEGHLSTFRLAALPAYAAVGGMAVPALIYIAFAYGDPVALRGWAVPTATDIVLAVSMLALLGRLVPSALCVFLTALAIFDDIGAVLIIGLFFGKEIDLLPLTIAGSALFVLCFLNKLEVKRIWPYAAVGGALWIALLSSGFEAALAGVLIGIAIPLRMSRPAPSPLHRIEHKLKPFVSFAVIPLFAFFNSGVMIDANAFNNLLAPHSLGIILGLLAGKPIGIVIATWVAVRLGAGQLPEAVSWVQLHGAAIIAGIGFTMSLFVATLSFSDPAILAGAKFAVLAGSLLSGASGLLILYVAGRSDHSRSAERA